MRVIHVAPTAFGADGLLGGGERYPLELAQALARHVDTRLVTFGPQRATRRVESGLHVTTLRARHYVAGHPAHPIALGLPRALAGADIVHTHHLRSAPSRLSALIARARDRAAVVTDHGLQGGDWRGLLPRLFHHFLTVSAYSARELHAPPDRTTVIYGGADPARFSPEPREPRRGVLFVGRLTPHKGVDRLIAALPDDAELRIVGSSGHDPAPPESGYPLLLRRLASGRRVSFLGPVPDDLLPSLYRSASVLALPSVERTCYGRDVRVSELLGLAVLEAMASGTPVVASRLGGIPEVVQDGITGFLVEPGNDGELRDRLVELLADRARAERLGRNARELVIDRFTWEAVAQRCLAVYSRLLPTRGRTDGR